MPPREERPGSVRLPRPESSEIQELVPSARGSRPLAGQTAPLAPDRWSAGFKDQTLTAGTGGGDALRVARIFRLARSRVKRLGSAALRFSTVQLLRLPMVQTQKRTESSVAHIISALVLEVRAQVE